MIYFFTPYSINKRMFEAWDACFRLVTNPADWLCMLDGDAAFLLPDFGHQLQQYIDKYPDTGIFTCYASRTSNPDQALNGINSDDPDIIKHRIIAEECYKNNHLRVKDIHKAYGHLILIRKSTWELIRPRVMQLTADSHLYNTDTAVSKAIRNNRLKIRVMEGVYILHYFRLKDKKNDHLL
jgi:hypothetical protein